MKNLFNFSFVLGLMLIIVGIVRLFNGIDIVSIFAIALGIMEIFLSLSQRKQIKRQNQHASNDSKHEKPSFKHTQDKE